MLGLLPPRGQDLRHLLRSQGPAGQVDDGTGLHGRALLVIAKCDDGKSVALLHAQQIQRSPGADQAPLIHCHDGVPVQPDRAVPDTIKQDGERFDILAIDTGGGQIVGLPPCERGAVDRSPLIAPRSNERLEGRGLPRTCRGDGQPELPTKAKTLDCCSLGLAMLSGKVQPGLLDRAV